MNFNQYYNKQLNKLMRVSFLKLIISTVFLDVLIAALFSYVIFPSHKEGPIFNSLLDSIIVPLIVAPFFETLLFQKVIIDFILEKFNQAFLVSCLSSAILFGLSHYYSPQYILVTFISGILYATLYMVTLKKNGFAFFSVVIAHALFNLVGLSIKYFT